ncbi:MAG: RNA polymerase sigma factor [Planctomycetes bacterium]|nr:RNA polymerase sigma factor [Planctomycetota bacterium]MCB9909086.1 RNA polymerase sigma factor [Planctomycetota bacterium]MCB9911667.1 RNA polymerase sigma factor [Planctomycetota bacterium]
MQRRSLRLKLDRAGEERRDWQAARDGDRDAYGRLVAQHFGGVYGLLFRLVGSPEDAEDLAQETFVRGFGALPEAQEGGNLRPWFTRIAVHLFYDHLRKRGRGAGVVQLDPLAEQVDGREPEPMAAMEQREAQALLGAAIERLPQHLQVALNLRVVEGRDYPEVARTMGVKVATVRTQVHQARRLLLRLLSHWLGEEDR